MSTPLEKVLLATDGSEDAALAAEAAAGICQKSGARLYVVHVWQTVPSAHMKTFVRSEFERLAREKLDAEVQKLQSMGISRVEPYLLEGKPADRILDLAEELDAGLIVLGSRGLGTVKRLALGSVAEGVIHHASRPVLVLRGDESSWPPARAVFADDGSQASREACEVAASLCAGHGVEGLIVRAYPRLPEMDAEGRKSDARLVEDDMRLQERTLMERAGKLEATLGSRPKLRLATGDATSCILQAAEEENPERTLVAVGSRGLGTVGRMRLGSVSSKTLRTAQGPVLVHPPTGKLA